MVALLLVDFKISLDISWEHLKATNEYRPTPSARYMILHCNFKRRETCA